MLDSPAYILRTTCIAGVSVARYNSDGFFVDSNPNRQVTKEYSANAVSLCYDIRAIIFRDVF